MRRTLTAGAACALALTLGAVALSGGAASAHDAPQAGRHFYTTKTPYAPQQALNRYQRAPRGFAPIFTENVARHGSRAMTDSGDGDAVLAVLTAARFPGRAHPAGRATRPAGPGAARRC